MEILLQIGLSNALVATVGALVVAVLVLGLGGRSRWPALVHGLWLLVLLKLVTPPLVWIPISWPAERLPVPIAARPVEVALEPAELLLRAVEDLPPLEPANLASDVLVQMLPLPEEAPAGPAFAPEAGWSWPVLVGGVWLATSLGWFVLAGLRVRRFQQLLRHARPASEELQQRTRRLAGRLGLKQPPSVWLLPGRLPPMLWAVGGAPRLLVPVELLAQVNNEQLGTLLVHELAHLKRRDHWVRLLEFLVTGLYWWHPAVWFVRRELREAEEQCCDAWVVSLLPGSGRTYATALVETLDFLSQPRAATPLLASGIGKVSDLKRRLTLIMRGTTPRSLSWRGLLAVLSLGGMLLPLLPTWAQEKADSFWIDLEIVKDAKAADADVAKVRAEVERLRAELEKKLAEAGAMELRLREAAKKVADSEKHEVEKHLRGTLIQALNLARPEDGKGRQAGGKTITLREINGKWVQVEPAKDTILWKVQPQTEKKVEPQQPADFAKLRLQMLTRELQGKLVEVEGAKKQDRVIRIELQGAQDKAPKTVFLREIDGKWVQVEPPKEAPKVPSYYEWRINPTVPTPATPPQHAPRNQLVALPVLDINLTPKAPPGGDNRIEQLERKLESVLKELEALRKDMHKKPAAPGNLAPPSPR